MAAEHSIRSNVRMARSLAAWVEDGEPAHLRRELGYPEKSLDALTWFRELCGGQGQRKRCQEPLFGLAAVGSCSSATARYSRDAIAHSASLKIISISLLAAGAYPPVAVAESVMNVYIR